MQDKINFYPQLLIMYLLKKLMPNLKMPSN